jgi:hypothetical protein
MLMSCGCKIEEAGVVPKTLCMTHGLKDNVEVPELRMHGEWGDGCAEFRPERVPQSPTDLPMCVCGKLWWQH